MSAPQNTRQDKLFFATMSSPLGTIMLAGTTEALMYLDFPLNGRDPLPHSSWQRDHTRFQDEIGQLEQYFEGERKDFNLPIAFDGGSFNNAVWTELTNIPYGEVITYGELAKRVGKPDGAQAVGNANGKNPIPIIVPCHRVIAAKNSIGGFTGGVEKKQFLLQLEKAKNVQFGLF